MNASNVFRRIGTALTLLAAAAPLAVMAHTGSDDGGHHGFLTGALHPLTGPDHLAAMVGVGLWSALIARRAFPDLIWAPLGFAGMLLVGALMGLAGVAMPAVEPMIAASLLVIGLLVVARLRMPGVAAAAIVGVFAIFHGVAHGNELAGESAAAATLAGMLAATALLHGVGIALGWAVRNMNAWAPRFAGAAVAIFGVTLLVRMA